MYMYLHIDHINVYNTYQPGIYMEDCATFRGLYWKKDFNYIEI